jgi:hypothetical protein
MTPLTELELVEVQTYWKRFLADNLQHQRAFFSAVDVEWRLLRGDAAKWFLYYVSAHAGDRIMVAKVRSALGL